MKRAADHTGTSSGTSLIADTSEQSGDDPTIVYRYHHRRRNVAAATWGPDIPLDHSVAFAAPVLGDNHQPFNIYKAILRHPNLFFQFALRLPYSTIIDLYAIDKEFHYRLNQFSVSLIHDYAKCHVPLASHIFSWTLYPHLCISDPMLRPMDNREWLARDVPGFRWVGMVLWREKVARSILTRLALSGHRVPAGTLASVMKFWVVMEMRTTAQRLTIIHDRDIWTDRDIFYFQLFLVKLDMRFADPILGNGVCELSHMLLTQRSLAPLWRLLTGKTKLDHDSATDMLIRTYKQTELDTHTHGWIADEVDNGVPHEEWGLMCSEEWEQDGARMDSVVDMVIGEGINRSLNVQQYYLDFVMYGHVDEQTGLNLPAPRLFRKDRQVFLPRHGYPDKALKMKMQKRLEEHVTLQSGPVVNAGAADVLMTG